MSPIEIPSWSLNPKSITIGDHETLTFEFKYYSPGKAIKLGRVNPSIINIPTLTTKKVGNDDWASVTVVGAENGSGTVQLNVITYSAENSVSTTTTINVVAPRAAHQIKFFDTNNEPLANNKLIASKHIYQIKQSDNEASKGTQCSTLNKCLKTTDSSAYVKFTYWESTGSTMNEKEEYSWVTLSDHFNLPKTSGAMQPLNTGQICLKGIIDDTSRNITRDMLQINGKPKQGGITYWYIVSSFTIMA